MAAASARHAHSAARLSAGMALAVVLVVAAVAILVALIDPNAIANRVTQQALPQVSAALGRDVKVGAVEVGWFPVRVELHDLRVAGGPGEPELLHATVAVRPRLWPLIKSRGHDVQISKVTLRDAQLNLVQRADGTWDLPEGQQSSPPTQRKFAIDEVTLDRGAVRLYRADEGAKPDPLLALTDIHFAARDLAAGQPLRAVIDAALAPEKSDARNLHLEVSLSALPADAASARSSPPSVNGTLHLDRLQLAALHALLPASAQGMVQGGMLSVDAQVAGTLSAPTARGKVALDGASLRGKPAHGSFAFEATPDQLAVRELSVVGPGVQLGGTATASLAAKRMRFAISGPLLDLDALLAALPQSSEEKAPSSGLSASARAQLEALDVSGTLAVQKVVLHKLEASDLHADAKLQKGALVLTRADAQLYGGTFDASGATIDLSQPKPAWSLDAKLRGVDLGVATRAVAGEQPLAGKATGTLALHGEGSDWASLREKLTGQGSLQLADAALASGNLGAQLAGPLRAALPGKVGGAVASAATGTKLQDLAMGFTVKDGFLELAQPISFKSDFGSAKLGGRIGLDWRLDLSGDVALAPGFVSQLSSGALKPSAETSLPVKIGGTLTRPALQPSESGAALATRLMGASPAGKAVEQGKKQIENQARRGLQHLLRP